MQVSSKKLQKWDKVNISLFLLFSKSTNNNSLRCVKSTDYCLESNSNRPECPDVCQFVCLSAGRYSKSTPDWKNESKSKKFSKTLETAIRKLILGRWAKLVKGSKTHTHTHCNMNKAHLGFLNCLLIKHKLQQTHNKNFYIP